MDSIVLPALFLEGIALFLLVVAPRNRLAKHVFLVALAGRAIALCLRSNIGYDVANYRAVLGSCDLTSINGVELFWPVACLPTASLDLPFPFIVIGALDCVLFFAIARMGGYRVAALHDLIYLPTQEMGAIRQALAMKLILVAVLMQLAKERGKLPVAVALTTPFIHISAVIPAIVVFMRRLSPVSWIVFGLLVLGVSALLLPLLLDEALRSKIEVYLAFEGYRSETQILASWGKRLILVPAVIGLLRPAMYAWVLYGLGLLFAMSEFEIPEIAVRIGAYFEQFESLLLVSPFKPRFRKFAPPFYVLVGVAYAGRFMSNLLAIPSI